MGVLKVLVIKYKGSLQRALINIKMKQTEDFNWVAFLIEEYYKRYPSLDKAERSDDGEKK